MSRRSPLLVALVLLTVVLAAAAPPIAAHHWAPIQPGASITTPSGGCTMNFVYASETNASLYVGTAGHCADVGERAEAYPEDPLGREPFGTVVFDGLEADPPVDFALVRIDPSWHDRIDPGVRRWGGPTGVGAAEPGETILFYGHANGMDASEPTRSRVGKALETHVGPPAPDEGLNTTVDQWTHAIPTSFGDSGGPLIDAEGQAVGVVAETGADGRLADNSSYCSCPEGNEQNTTVVADARVSPSMAAVVAALEDGDWRVSLVTAPFDAPFDEPEDPVDRYRRILEHCRSDLLGSEGCLLGIL